MQIQFARVGIVIGAERVAAASIELEGRQTIGVSFTGLALHADTGGFDYHQTPRGLFVVRDVHGDLHLVLGIENAPPDIELGLRALHVIVLIALFVKYVERYTGELVLAVLFLEVVGLNRDDGLFARRVGIFPAVIGGRGSRVERSG